jgi:flagellar P-ring protein FlgI
LPAARLKDLVSIEGVRPNQLIGYGIVVGLAGKGDSQQTIFPYQSLANILERMGVAVSPTMRTTPPRTMCCCACRRASS